MTFPFIEKLAKRPRRNRQCDAIRTLVQETKLLPHHLIIPFFVIPGIERREKIEALPFVERLSPDLVLREAENYLKKGVRALALFPVIEKDLKDNEGSEALNPDNLVHKTIKLLKKELPEMLVIADVALDPYTSHGHDGLINDRAEILNDDTVCTLAEMALRLAESGVDFVAPSDMMDGRIGAIRRKLDLNNFHQTGIISYAAKYASSLYGPFREALDVELAFGDKKTYQMDPANSREALRECALDEEEGADVLLIKPALSYLDIISKARAETRLPLAAYHVSGEYSMVMAAHQNGWLDGPKVLYEHLLSIKRAGADMIFTYAAPLVLPHIRY